MRILKEKTGFIKKWESLNLLKQLANIGSEVIRAFSLESKKDYKNMKKSVYRAMELIDLTIRDKKNRKRVFEIGRLKEALADLFFNNNSFQTNEEKIKYYFLQMAIKSFSQFSQGKTLEKK